MLAVLLCLAVAAGRVEHQVELPHSPISLLETESEGTIPVTPGGYAGWDPGLPDLPCRSELVELPPGTEALSVMVERAEWSSLPGSWEIRPLPPPAILSRMDRTGDCAPDPAVYGNDAFWPAVPVELTGTATMAGSPYACLVVFPFRYNPVRGTMERLESLSLSLDTGTSGRAAVQAGEGEGYARMLIVTDSGMAEAFEELASWRTVAGLYTDVVSTDSAYGWPGCDNAERIRNFVIDYRAEHGLDYLMLGGDTVAVPCRFAYPMTYQTGGGRDDNMPCDLYYADLDGTWNADGDTIWGELADSVDLAPDVAVGRASVEDIAEAWDFVDKTIAYEQASVSDHLERGLFIAQIMMEDPYTPGAVSKDYIDDEYMPGGWEVTKLYESEGTYGSEETVDALNLGTGCLNVSAHGWTNCAGCLGNDEVEQVSSGGRYAGLAYATSCWSGAFDFDCVAENYVNHPDGCGVGFIANSSYGWGSPGNPLYGYSDRLDQSVYDHLFADSSLSMGEVLVQAKTEYIPFAGQENCYRCLLYMANLFGDPSLVPYRGAPVDPVVSLPGLVTPQTTVIPVSVELPEGSPAGSHVCISSPGLSIYEVRELDGSGVSIVDLPQAPEDDITVTVTGPGLRRSSTVIPFGSGNSLVVSGVEVNTPEGYWVPAPGCSTSVSVTLSNQGSSPLTSVGLSAQLLAGPGDLLEGEVSYGDLSPGETGQGDSDLELLVDQSAGNGQLLQLQLGLTSEQGSWDFPLPLLVCAPGIYCCGWSVDDSLGGNGNGYPEAGEEFDLLVDVANTGMLGATDVSITVADQVPWLEWTSDSCHADTVSADSTAQLVFGGSLDAAAPEPGFPHLLFDMEADPQLACQDTIVMTVGDMGFSEDVESGAPGWSHGGENDLWHITSTAGHSGQCSWHCGQDTTGYVNDMDCWLSTPEVYLGPESELTFWSRFELYLYGADGLYVVLHNLDLLQRDTLDFIGSGGLLALQGPGGDGNLQWLPRSYDLSEYGYGTCCRVEFRFHSDESETGGGFWLDDISLCGWAAEPTAAEPGSPLPAPTVGSPAPNPAGTLLRIPLSIGSGPVRVGMYDLAGRIVWHADFEDGMRGTVSVPVAGMASGVYLIRVEHPDGGSTRKAVVLGRGR
jgi:hypothetical protein